MAVTNTSISQVSASFRFEDSDSGGTAVAVKATSGTVYAVEVLNPSNAAVHYVRLWDTASGSVTVGTTAPIMIIPVPASANVSVAFLGGYAFGTAITVATTTSAGTAGSTGPTSDIVVRIVYA